MSCYKREIKDRTIDDVRIEQLRPPPIPEKQLETNHERITKPQTLEKQESTLKGEAALKTNRAIGSINI